MYFLSIVTIGLVVSQNQLVAFNTPLRQQSYTHSVEEICRKISYVNKRLQNEVISVQNSRAHLKYTSRLYVRPEDFASGKILKPLPFRGFPMPQVLDEEDIAETSTKSEVPTDPVKSSDSKESNQIDSPESLPAEEPKKSILEKLLSQPEPVPAKVAEPAPAVAVESLPKQEPQKSVPSTVVKDNIPVPEPTKSLFDNLRAKAPKESEPSPAVVTESTASKVPDIVAEASSGEAPSKNLFEKVKPEVVPAPGKATDDEAKPVEETTKTQVEKILSKPEPPIVIEPEAALVKDTLVPSVVVEDEKKPVEEPPNSLFEKLLSKPEPVSVTETAPEPTPAVAVVEEVKPEEKKTTMIENSASKTEAAQEDSKPKTPKYVESKDTKTEPVKPSEAELSPSPNSEKEKVDSVLEPVLAAKVESNVPLPPSPPVPEPLPIVIPPETASKAVTSTGVKSTSPSAIGLRLPDGPLEAAKAFGIPFLALAVGRQILTNRNAKRKEIEEELKAVEQKKNQEIESLNNDLVVNIVTAALVLLGALFLLSSPAGAATIRLEQTSDCVVTSFLDKSKVSNYNSIIPQETNRNIHTRIRQTLDRSTNNHNVQLLAMGVTLLVPEVETRSIDERSAATVATNNVVTNTQDHINLRQLEEEERSVISELEAMSKDDEMFMEEMLGSKMEDFRHFVEDHVK